MNTKNLKRNISIIILLSIIITFFIVKDDFIGITDKLLKLEWRWFSLAIVMVILYYLFMALSLKKLVRKFDSNYKMKNALAAVNVINFMSSITPANAGAPPAAIYVLKNQGLKTREASHIGVLFLTIYKISFIAIATIAIISNFFFDYLKGDYISGWFVTVSYWLTVGLMLSLILISYNARVNKWLFSSGIKVLYKFKIIKDLDKTTNLYHGYIDDFIAAGHQLKSDRMRITLSIIYYLMAVIAFMLVPYFCIKGVHPSVDLNIIIALVISVYVCLIGTIVPLPGSSGGTEMAYYFFYIKFVPSATILATSLLLYRLLTYHLVVLIGGLVFIKVEND